jgi:GT2 family glycosyltransferase
VNVSVVVATFGSSEWQKMGSRTAKAHGAFHCHLPEGTLAGARNLGAASVPGEWLCFLDADDELHAGYLDAMRAALPPGGGRHLLAPAVCFVGRRGQRKPARIPSHAHLRDLTQGNWLVIGTLVQAAVFREAGGFREYPIYEDWDLWLRCWKRGAEIVEVPGAVYVARVRPSSRNRGPTRTEKLRWHTEIAAANA